MIIAVDKEGNDCRFTEASWGLCKEKNKYRLFKNEIELEKWWRTKHPALKKHRRIEK